MDIEADKGEQSFVQGSHTLGTLPGVTIAQISTHPDSDAALSNTNPQKRLTYDSIGSVMADEYYDENYGGMLFAVSKTGFRLWVPSVFQLFQTGYSIHVGKGWGQSGTDDVSYKQGKYRVQLRKAKPADYDSGWFNMASNHPELSFMELKHSLGKCTLSKTKKGGALDGPCCSGNCQGINMAAAKVEVTYRPKTGSNAGYVFKASGSQQADGSGGRYGGLIYAYSDENVRIWAPNYSGLKNRLSVGAIWVRCVCFFFAIVLSSLSRVVFV